MSVPKAESCGTLCSLFWCEISLDSWQSSLEQFHISVKLSPAAHLAFGAVCVKSWIFSCHPCLPPCEQLLSFLEEIMLLEDFISLIIFSFFLCRRDLMGKQTLGSCALWLASWGTLCPFDSSPVSISFSASFSIFLLWVRSRSCLVCSVLLKKVMFPVLFLQINMLEVCFWLQELTEQWRCWLWL